MVGSRFSTVDQNGHTVESCSKLQKEIQVHSFATMLTFGSRILYNDCFFELEYWLLLATIANNLVEKLVADCIFFPPFFPPLELAVLMSLLIDH